MTKHTRTETRTRTTEVPRYILGIQFGTRIHVETYTVEVEVPKVKRAPMRILTPAQVRAGRARVLDALWDVSPEARDMYDTMGRYA